MKPKLKTIKKIVDYLNDLAAINDGNPSTEDIKRLKKKHKILAMHHAEIVHLGFATYVKRNLKMNKVVYHPIDARKVMESMYNRYPSLTLTKAQKIALGKPIVKRNKAEVPAYIPDMSEEKRQEIIENAKDPWADFCKRQQEAGLMAEFKSETKWVSADEFKQMAEKLYETDNIQTKQRIAKLENQPRKKVSILWGLIKWEI